MKKKLLVILLSFVMVVTMVPLSVFASLANSQNVGDEEILTATVLSNNTKWGTVTFYDLHEKTTPRGNTFQSEIRDWAPYYQLGDVDDPYMEFVGTTDAFYTVVEPAEGYRFKVWSPEPTIVKQAVYFKEDLTFTAVFAANTYDIAKAELPTGVKGLSVQVGGTEASQAETDEQVHVEATPDSGYQIKKITITPTDTSKTPIDITGGSGDFTMPASNVNITVTAEKTYTVTFDSNGGTAVTPQTVEEGQCATEPEPPTRDEYEFAGWYDDTAKPPVKFDFTTPINSNLTLTAHWTAITYPIAPKKADHIESIGAYSDSECTTSVTSATKDTKVYLKAIAEDETNPVTNYHAIGKTSKQDYITSGETSFTMPNEEVEIWAEVDHYNLTVDTSVEHCTVDLSDPIAKPGETITATVTPERGFKVTDVEFIPTSQLESNSGETGLIDTYSYTMGTGDVTVKPVIEEATSYEITTSAEHGTITATVGEEVEEAYPGDTVSLSYESSEGYIATGYTVKYIDKEGKEQEVAVTDNTFEMPEADVTVAATEAKGKFNISITQPMEGQHGTIVTTPASEQVVGEEVQLSMQNLDPEYTIVKYIVEDAKQQEVTVENNKFTMPPTDVIVTAELVQNEYNVVVNAPVDAKGSVTATPEQGVLGSKIELNYSVDPALGYTVDEYIVKDAAQNPVETETVEGVTSFSMPSGGAFVTFTEKPQTYNITIDSPEHLAIESEPADKAEYNEVVKLVSEPDAGYELDEYTVTDVTTGQLITVSSSGEFTMPASDVTVTASTVKVPHNITVNNPSHGNVDVKVNGEISDQAVIEDSVELTYTAHKAGWTLDHFEVVDSAGNTVQVVQEGNQGTFEMPGYDTNVIAVEKQFRVLIDETNFPDSFFREFVEENLDKDHDGYLSEDELAVEEIEIRGIKAENLKGIENFIELKTLNCGESNVRELDVSSNTELEVLKCDDAYIENLDVSNNKMLRELGCAFNNLHSLDVSQNKELKVLSVGINTIETLDVSNNTKLENLACEHCGLTDLDLSANTELKTLATCGNNLGELNLENNTQLQQLNCGENGLRTLDVRKNTELKDLDCKYNSLTELNLDNNSKLESLSCTDNSIEELNLANKPLLSNLRCEDNELESLDVSKNTELKYLMCSGNKLGTLDLGQNTKLENLDCSDNALEGTLNVSKSPELKEIHCEENQLTGLTFAKDSELKYLFCNANNLEELNLSNLSELSMLNCSENELETLDVLKNTKLTELFCYDNKLSELNIAENSVLCSEDGTGVYCGNQRDNMDMILKTNCQQADLFNKNYASEPENAGVIVDVCKHFAKYIKLEPATLTKDGVKEHYKCTECGELFEDEECTKKIDDISVLRIALPKTFTLSEKEFDYTGKAIKPEVVVKDADGKDIPASNYVLSYKNNVNPGTATALVTFKGNYSGTKNLTFKINSPKPVPPINPPKPVPPINPPKPGPHINPDNNGASGNGSANGTSHGVGTGDNTLAFLFGALGIVAVTTVILLGMRRRNK